MGRDMDDGSKGSTSSAVDVDGTAVGSDAAEAVDAEMVDLTAVAEDTGSDATISEDAVVALIAERDEYLDALQRLKAEFANARRRSAEQAAATRSQAAADLVEKLLPILDSCEAAAAHGIEAVRPIADALFDVLSAQGLEPVDPVGEAFDPELHEAVVYEAAETDQDHQIVVETLRTGYRWNKRVLRAPMVKVQG